jgi:hypothetical protein
MQLLSILAPYLRYGQTDHVISSAEEVSRLVDLYPRALPASGSRLPALPYPAIVQRDVKGAALAWLEIHANPTRLAG